MGRYVGISICGSIWGLITDIIEKMTHGFIFQSVYHHLFRHRVPMQNISLAWWQWGTNGLICSWYKLGANHYVKHWDIDKNGMLLLNLEQYRWYMGENAHCTSRILSRAVHFWAGATFCSTSEFQGLNLLCHALLLPNKVSERGISRLQWWNHPYQVQIGKLSLSWKLLEIRLESESERFHFAPRN